MPETESITVAEVSEGPCGSGRPGESVDLPVVELLTGRGFVTGKSGAGKSNSASVITEKLLDAGFGMLIVDIDGEYYGLKEEYEILHVGADDECDIQVTVEHAEKIASLALEQNVPIILDMSSFLDEEDGQELLTAVSRQLFAKAKKLKQPFLMLVEEVHEYIPQQGSVGECGKMLIKISKRGRKHGLGIVGISQRPADVKKDFITQCDWLVWHRLTWNNDTKVVKRILDADYAAEVEVLDNGEAFMMTDWSETVRRVQFHRKQTFDAGATPGLDDFERPDLKSVSDDLVSELQEISEEEQARENRIAELREELDEKNSRIAELEAELQDARDMQRMADQFTQALVEHVEGANPGRTEQTKMRRYRQVANGDAPAASSGNGATPNGNGHANGEAGAVDPGLEDAWGDGSVPDEAARDDDGYDDAVMTWVGDEKRDPDESSPGSVHSENGNDGEDKATGTDGAEEISLPDGIFDSESGGDSGTSDAGGADGAGAATGASPTRAADATAATGGGTAAAGASTDSATTPDVTRGFAGVEENPLGDRATDAFERGTTTAVDPDAVEEAAAFTTRLADDLHDLDLVTRQMLRYYRDHGPGTPMDALFSAAGADDRTSAYAHNRRLRVRGLVEHVGRGRYDYRLPDLLREQTDCERVDPFLEQVESAIDGEEVAAQIDGDGGDTGGPDGTTTETVTDRQPTAESGSDDDSPLSDDFEPNDDVEFVD